jgi:ABC-2 type transport system permease protein
MRNVWLIAKREYIERVRSKAFVITTVLVPLIVAGLVVIIIFSSNSEAAGKHIAITSNDAAFAQAVQARMTHGKKNSEMRVDVYAPATDADRAHLESEMNQKKIEGVLTLTVKPGVVQPTATYQSHDAADFVTTGILEDAVDRATTERQLAGRGMSPAEVDTLLKNVHIETLQSRNGKVEKSSAAGTFWTAYLMAFLLSFTSVMYGMNVGRSVIEEKTSRIFEVMLATVRPEEMMAGKLIGVGAVGMTQLLIWIAGAALLLASPMAARAMSNGFTVPINGLEVFLFCVYFLLGYLFNSVLSAALAASVSTEQELNQFWPVNVIPIWISFGMISYIITNPNSWLSVAVSLFPPTAPIVMFLRMGARMPPAWQILVSVLLLALSIFVMIWLASRIYRVGILMYGKRATLPEIVRWLRYS